MNLLFITTRNPFSIIEQDGGTIFASQIINHVANKLELDILFLREMDSQLEVLNNIKKVHFLVPNVQIKNRFLRRIDTSVKVSEWLERHHHLYDIVLLQHVSSGFGFINLSVSVKRKMILFPMFTGKSYRRSGEEVPDLYIDFETRVLQSIHLIVCPSKAEAADIILDYKVDPQCIQFIPFGVDLKKFSFQKRSIDTAQLELLYVATIKKQKNQLECVEVARHLWQRSINVKIHLVGGIADKRYHTQLLEKIAAGGLEKSIVIHDVLQPQQIFELAKRCVLSISTTHWETFGIAIFESLAMGLPVITFDDVPCFWEYLPHNSACIGLPRDAMTMANKIIELVNAPAEYTRMNLQTRKDILHLAEEVVSQSLIHQIILFYNDLNHSNFNEK